MKNNLFIIVCGALLFSSCAPRVPFTQSIREQYNLTDEELKQIQFYASHDIILQRGESEESGKATEEGKLVLTEGKSVEQVMIRAGTPGVVEDAVDKNRVSVSFEAGEDKLIVFGDPYDKKGRYTLLAKDWKNNKGVMEYGGKTYYAAAGSSNVYLTFKMRKLRKFSREARVVKGRKL